MTAHACIRAHFTDKLEPIRNKERLASQTRFHQMLSTPSDKKVSALSCLLVPNECNEISLSLIKPFIGIRDMHMLSVLRKGLKWETYTAFTRSAHGLRQWIDIAVRITNDPARGFIPSVINEHLSSVAPSMIFPNIRQLVCPWTSERESLPVTMLLHNIPKEGRMFVTAEPDQETRLVFQSRDLASKRQASCPARNRVGFKSDVVLDEPKIRIAPSELDYFEEIQHKFMALNNRPFLMPDFTQRFSITHTAFPVHGGVFAVMEFFTGGYVRHSEGENGVYYFDYTGRFLRHDQLFRGLDAECCYMQSRPYNIWFLLNGTVEYSHGVGCCSRKDHHKTTLASPKERMFPALWMAASGDSEGALRYLARDLKGLCINTRSSLNERTLLHYAAVEGRHDAVKALISEKADARLRDFNGDTALTLACEKFHHETVQVLMELGDLEPRDISRAWEVFCQMGGANIMTPFRPTEAIHFQCRVQTPAITKSLLKGMASTPFDILVKGFKSSMVIASPEAMETIITMGGNQVINYFNRWGAVRFLFGDFQTHDHMLESLKTLRYVYGTLNMDVNRIHLSENETPLVWAVRDGTVEAVQLLIEEFNANVFINPITGTDIMMEARLRCAGAPGSRDLEGEKILYYLQERFP